VDDVGQTVAFYEEVFGAAKIDETLVNGVPVVCLRLEDTDVWVSGPILPDLQSHAGLAAEDFDAALEELKMRGVEFLGEPLWIGAQRLVFVRDGNGQQIGITSGR
jgi:predicted enzyme related to lactoylglutathione lyase